MRFYGNMQANGNVLIYLLYCPQPLLRQSHRRYIRPRSPNFTNINPRSIENKGTATYSFCILFPNGNITRLVTLSG